MTESSKDETMNSVYKVKCPKCGCVWGFDRPMPESVICPVGYGCSKEKNDDITN